MDLRLVLRYKQYAIDTHDSGIITLPKNILSFTIARKPIELKNDGLYDILLSFTKQV